MNTAIPSTMNLFMIHAVQLVAKVVCAQREENLVNVFICKVNVYVYVYVFFILIWREIALYTNTV